jgi:hypothetical protein
LRGEDKTPPTWEQKGILEKRSKCCINTREQVQLINKRVQFALPMHSLTHFKSTLVVDENSSNCFLSWGFWFLIAVNAILTHSSANGPFRALCLRGVAVLKVMYIILYEALLLQIFFVSSFIHPWLHCMGFSNSSRLACFSTVAQLLNKQFEEPETLESPQSTHV